MDGITQTRHLGREKVLGRKGWGRESWRARGREGGIHRVLGGREDQITRLLEGGREGW